MIKSENAVLRIHENWDRIRKVKGKQKKNMRTRERVTKLIRMCGIIENE
jgi:hypothetical protein